MKRYYVRETGYDLSRRLAMGELLNDDGSVYTPVMATDQNFDSKNIHQTIPTVSVDGYDIEIKKVSTDNTYVNHGKVTLVFWQERGDSKDVVASLSLQAFELDKLKDKIAQKLKDFQSE